MKSGSLRLRGVFVGAASVASVCVSSVGAVGCCGRLSGGVKCRCGDFGRGGGGGVGVPTPEVPGPLSVNGGVHGHLDVVAAGPAP